jgi:hypothetical protein
MLRAQARHRTILHQAAVLKKLRRAEAVDASHCLAPATLALGISGLYSRKSVRGAVPRFCGTFRSVDVAVDDLKVGQSPKIEQSRPGRVSLFTPDSKQRDAMVNFGVPPQPPAALGAPPTLDAPQQLDLATWRIPELPCDHARTVPDRILVGTGLPKVNVPAEAINGLAAHAARSWPKRVRVFTERCGCRAERERQAAPAVPQPPSPVSGRLAASGKCSRQAIGPNWMGAPV